MTVPAASLPNARRSRIMRGIVAVSVTACAAALMLFLRSLDVAPSDGATQIAQPEELRPFLENDHWRIVVLKVHSKDRKEVMRIIESLAARNGMDIQSVVGKDDHDHDARFGVLFTSTGDNDNALIEHVISETDAQSADWNPKSVADSSSDRFIHRLQESMKSPTLSELHFGQVYMAMLKSAKSPAAASPPLVAQNDTVEGASPPSAATETAAALPNEAAIARIPPSARKTPVLVVFEFNEKSPAHI